MKKEVKSSYTFRPKVDEAPEILEFLTSQDNYSDAIRYLIEKEISENGIRNLALYIPSVRNIKINSEIALDRTTKKIEISDASDADKKRIQEKILKNIEDKEDEIEVPHNNEVPIQSNFKEDTKEENIINSNNLSVNKDILSCYED